MPAPVPDGVRVVLLGQMGAGKSTVGRALARRLGWPFLDNDEELHRRTGRDAATIAAAADLASLHALEREVFRAQLTARPPVVLAAAASVVDTVRAVDLPPDAFVVWLRAAPTTLAARSTGSGHRPRGSETTTWYERTRQRDAQGAALADLVVDTGGRDVAAVVEEVLTVLPRPA